MTSRVNSFDTDLVSALAAYLDERGLLLPFLLNGLEIDDEEKDQISRNLAAVSETEQAKIMANLVERFGQENRPMVSDENVDQMIALYSQASSEIDNLLNNIKTK